MNEKELMQLRDKINAGKTQADRLRGQLQYLMKELSENHDCRSVADAQLKVESINKRIDALNDRIQEETAKVEKMLKAIDAGGER